MNCRGAVTTPITWLLAFLLAACASVPQADPLHGLLPTPLLLLGEQHDAPEHQAFQRQAVQRLAAAGQLAAVVLEMGEQGQQTTGLPTDASEAQVRTALSWTEESNSGAWPWTVYGPVVMAAVRAGVPVLGGNLPRSQIRSAMADLTLDTTLTPDALQRQQEAIRDGHCGLLPQSQIAPMTRVQLARDRSLAQTAIQALRPGQTVLLIAGNAHLQRDLGVPRHLAPGQAHRVVLFQARSAPLNPETGNDRVADRVWITSPRPPQDHCAELRRQMKR